MGKAKLTNEEVLTKGLRKAGAVIIRTLVQRCVPLCKELIKKADETREFCGFTGNTQTSYACLICVGNDIHALVKGEVKDYYFQPKTYVYQTKYTDPPIKVKSGPAYRKGVKTDLVTKVRLDEWAYLSHPYEGSARSVTGHAAVNNETGKDTSTQEMNKYKQTDSHIKILMTTGTEYSQYLEEARDFWVLTGAWLEAPVIVKDKLFVQLSPNVLK